MAPLLEVRDLAVHYPVRRGVLRRVAGVVRAVDGIGFALERGTTLGLVGESGCGKSTTGLALMGLVRATGGSVRLGGAEVSAARGPALRALRRRMQIVFQDPFSSLNPRQTVAQILRAPLDIHAVGTGAERRAAVARLMAEVGLRPDQAGLYPHQFSGGQRQRIGIARALALRPDILICDEPVSALDVSVQAQILNLLGDLQRAHGLAYLMISHDLGVVEHIAHRIAVMYRGRIVEAGAKADVLDRPAHPYTRTLLAAAPVPDPRQRPEMAVAPPVEAAPAAGCAFHPRCALASDLCRRTAPTLTPRGGDHAAACHHT